MSSLPARLHVAVLLAFAATACSTTPFEVRRTFADGQLPHVDVTIAVPPGHANETERYVHSAFTTLRMLGIWLAPFPDAALDVVPARTPWWSAPAAMAPEYAVARAVSRRFWERALNTHRLPDWFVDGLAEYCARRSVSKIVDERYLGVYRSRAEARYFGGFVPRDLQLPLRVEDEGDPVDEYRLRPRGTDARALAAKTLLALGTLDRWVGRPVFDEIVAELVRAGGEPSLDDIERVASRVSGQNLEWLFDQTLKSSRVLDYGVVTFSSVAQADGWYRTTVGVQRFGDGIFTGANAANTAPFERGRGIVVATAFGDGDEVRDAWDGRSSAKTFEYRSQSRAVSAEVDPDRVLLLDVNRANNGVTLDPGPARTAGTRWAARWMIWLEDAMLTYVAFT